MNESKWSNRKNQMANRFIIRGYSGIPLLLNIYTTKCREPTERTDLTKHKKVANVFLIFASEHIAMQTTTNN